MAGFRFSCVGSRNNSWLVWAVLVALAAMIPAVPHAQQGSTGGITGTVADSSGRAIPNAEVKAKDVARGTEYPTQSNSAGIYVFSRLPVGLYTVTAQAQGFAVSVKPAFELELDQIARVDIELQVGNATQTITVSSAPPLLQQDTMEVGYVIGSNLNANLPLATRNFAELTLLTPGATTVDPSSFENGAKTTLVGGRPYVNGNREETNNYLLDGHSENQLVGNYYAYQPSVDAIEEFNEITNNAPAQYGQFQGAIVSVTLKSGTDAYHGAAFEFFRNDVLNANNWANDWQGIAKPALRYNQFGATVGGPIIKHKLFFFADYEGIRLDNPPSTVSWTVMTAAERAGDFSEELTPPADSGLTVSRPIYSPCASMSGPCLQPANPEAVRTAFPDNKIPASMIDPVATALFNSGDYPLPTNDRLIDNAVETASSATNNDQGDIKMDYALSDHNRFWGSYNQASQRQPSDNSVDLLGDQITNFPYYGGVLDWEHTFSPSMVLDLKLGDTHGRIQQNQVTPGVGDLATKIGIGGANVYGPGLPLLTFQGGLASAIGVSGVNVDLESENTLEPAAELILTRNRHVLHLGFDLLRQRFNSNYPGNNGVDGLLTYTGTYTSGADPTAPAPNAGLAEADFLLGLPYQVGLGINSGGGWGQRSTVLGVYGQDDWRATRNLTFNIGLRWQNNSPWIEVHDKMVNFAPLTGTAEFASQASESGPIWGPAGSCSTQLGSANCAVSSSPALYNPFHKDFEPRIGLAWKPGGFLGQNTVVRSAYTISSFLEGTGNALRLTLNPPFASERMNENTTGTLPYYPGSTTAQGLTVVSAPANPFQGANLRVWEPNVRPDMIQQWNLSIEHQFPGEMLLSVGYIGQHGTHLIRALTEYQRRLVGEGGCTTAQAVNFDGSPVLTCGSTFLAGNPVLNNEIGLILGTASVENQSYNALQVAVTKHVSQGLEFLLSYTYSKSLADSVGYYGEFNTQAGGGGAAFPQDEYNQHSDWGPAYFDIRHNFVGSYVYKLPYGTGLKFGSNANPILKGVLGNWQLSGIVTLHSGFPQTVTGPDESGTESLSPRANCLGTPSYPRGVGPNSKWFSTSQFAVPSTGTFGNCSNGTVLGPGRKDWDFGVSKIFNVTESKGFEFTTQFINFFNTPLFNAPNTSITSATFGQVLTSSEERNIQFGLKFHY